MTREEPNFAEIHRTMSRPTRLKIQVEDKSSLEIPFLRECFRISLDERDFWTIIRLVLEGKVRDIKAVSIERSLRAIEFD